MKPRAVVCFALVRLVAAPSWANYQVRGRFLYRDKEWGPSGLTGVLTDLPIRLAEVQVLDWNSAALLVSGATDDTGNFVINVADSQVRDVYVRVFSRAPASSSLEAQVRAPTVDAVYSMITPPYVDHSPTVNIDFTGTPIIAVPVPYMPGTASLGDVFNIFDQALDAFGFIASLNGAWPTRTLKLY